jgi:hypothetical protein
MSAPTPDKDVSQRESVLKESQKSRHGGQADSQPPNRKSSDSPAVGVSHASEKPKPKPKPAYRGDWTDEELAAVEDFLSEHMPETLEDWEQNGDIPDWLPQATLDAGLGSEPEEVFGFLRAKIDSGWIPQWWRSYPAVVRREFERRRRQGRPSKPWSSSDYAMVCQAAEAFMGETAPKNFASNCESRASGATAREVCAVIARMAQKGYRAKRWSYVYQAIGNEFNHVEQGRYPEPIAAPRPEHLATAEEMEQGIEALDVQGFEAVRMASPPLRTILVHAVHGMSANRSQG